MLSNLTAAELDSRRVLVAAQLARLQDRLATVAPTDPRYALGTAELARLQGKLDTLAAEYTRRGL